MSGEPVWRAATDVPANRAMCKRSNGHLNLATVAVAILAIRLTVPALAGETTPDSPAANDPVSALDEACRPPNRDISIPDGANATETEMLTTQAAVRHYDAAIRAYTFCLASAERRLLARDPGIAAALGAARMRLNNFAVQRAEEVVAAFNAALKIFRTRGYRPPVLRKAATSGDHTICGPQNRYKMTVNADVSLSETGEITAIEFPPGLAKEVQILVRCIIRRMAFDPAMLDQEAERAEFTLPVRIGAIQGSLITGQPPTVLMSREADIAAARFKCLPGDLARGGEVGVHVTVGPSGRVVSVKTMISSGIDEVDRVASCIALSLKYEPIRVQGQPAEMSMVPVIVRVAPRSRFGATDDD